MATKKISSEIINEEISKFKSKEKIFLEFLEEIIPLINNILLEKKINFHEVFSRSYRKSKRREIYKNQDRKSK